MCRPPGADVPVFTAYVDIVLSKINKEKKKCYIASDFNINLGLVDDTNVICYYSFLAARLSFTFMYTCIFFSWQIYSAAAAIE